MDTISAELAAAMAGAAETAEGLQAIFRLPPSFTGFAGHFPGRPILPAVAQIQMGCVLLAKLRGDSFIRPRQVNTAKFTRPVGPGEPVLAQAIPAAIPGRWKVVLTVNGEKAAEFTLAFEDAS